MQVPDLDGQAGSERKARRLKARRRLHRREALLLFFLVLVFNLALGRIGKGAQEEGVEIRTTFKDRTHAA